MLYRFQLKNGIFIGEHMTNYTKLLADLAWKRSLRTRPDIDFIEFPSG